MNKPTLNGLTKNKLVKIPLAVLTVLSLLGGGAYVFAASTSELTQAINPGTLSVDIVDGSYVSVATPSFTMSAVPFSFDCQTSTGSFGSATQQIYVKNPDAADNGWTMSIAGSAPTASWTSGALNFDFNDSNTAGCGDGADADSYKGQMTIDASGATLAKGSCATCNTTNISKGSSASFVEGTTDSITLLNAAAGSDDIGDWTLRNVSVSQKIPGEQAAANDYKINLTLTITAS